MAIIGDRIRDVIKKEINRNTDTIDHQVDCVCRDIRSGKSKPSDVKKLRKFIADALKVIATIKIAMETVEALQRSVEAARKAAEATRKASVIGASLNPVAAALGYLQETVIKKAEEEEKDAKDALNVAPILVTTFEDFCGRSLDRISQAIAQRAMKDSIGN